MSSAQRGSGPHNEKTPVTPLLSPAADPIKCVFNLSQASLHTKHEKKPQKKKQTETEWFVETGIGVDFA